MAQRHAQTLSLWDAIFINISVMFGTGVFINTVNLARMAGALGFLSYVIVALIMLPLVISISRVVSYFPRGSFYAYAQPLAKWAGFLSTWIYFFGKLASAALLIHVFSTTIKTVLAPLEMINVLAIDFFILILFTWLNHYNLKTSTKINYVFIALKFIPILFAILISMYLYRFWSLPPDTLLWHGIPATIPLVLYAFVGFEIACSISSSIQNAEKNAPKAILYSFAIVVFITLLYQLMVFLALGSTLMHLSHFLSIFPTFFRILAIDAAKTVILHSHIIHILHIALATAALGGSYGIMLSNAWNLHILADKNHIIGSSLLSKLNRYGIPFACIIVEALIVGIYLLGTSGNQLILQQTSVFACAIAYLLSIVGLLRIIPKSTIAWLGFLSSILLIAFCVRNFIEFSIIYLYFFLLFMVAGLLMYGIRSLFNNRKP